MRTSDFDYDLPPELIAQVPVEPRDSSRLLVFHRNTGHLEHRRFTDILEYLKPGDLMVFNQSRVIAARLLGHRDDTGSRVELLLLRRNATNTWQALAKPARRLHPGATITVDPPAGAQSSQSASLSASLSVQILESHDDGIKTVRLSSDAAISTFGRAPLPPYIRESLDDPERYQTVYATQPGSAAAPTAGLHFTQDLLGKIRDAGIETSFVTLHVGLDTFRPVQGDDPVQHKIHTEEYEIDPIAADALNRARAEGRRVIAVGTTSVRVLEQAAQGMGDSFSAVRGEAALYILPGYRFQAVDAMITNFHLPRSTLLMLVSAFAEGHGESPLAGSGRALVLDAYGEAIALRYRFYSFGDAMLVV